MLICSGIQKGDLIEINDEKCLELDIQFLTGKKIHLMLASTNTIRTVKYLFGLIEGIEVNHQILIFKGKQIENNRTIEEYCIQNGDKLYYVYKLISNLHYS